MANKKEVTILIPTMFDSRYTIELCLETIRKYTEYPYQIIVGDDGVDKETFEFLQLQQDIKLVDVPEDYYTCPKEFLSSLVNTDYYLLLHDDAQILKHGWLTRRVKIMESDKRNAIVGEVVLNYCDSLKRHLLFLYKKTARRFFPLGMLVKTEAARELDLKWGKTDKYDTGGYAYQQFIAQKKWQFVRCTFRSDIRHFGGMTWPVRKKLNNERATIDLDKCIEIRRKKIEQIKEILSEKKY